MSSPMTREDKQRIQASQAKNGHDTGKGSFAARAQSAVDTRENDKENHDSLSDTPSKTGQGQGGQGQGPGRAGQGAAGQGGVA
ncbi:MAG: hypothetical protein Q9212_005037 [Teloschistes hypoglaucus]